MKTHIQLSSTFFPPDPDEAELINDGRFGRKLAEYISAKLPEFGFSVDGLTPEDWGWQIQIRNPDFPLWIGCGNYEEVENGFLCFIEPSKPQIRRWFKRINTQPKVTRLSDALESIIANAPGVTNHNWWAMGTAHEP